MQNVFRTIKKLGFLSVVNEVFFHVLLLYIFFRTLGKK